MKSMKAMNDRPNWKIASEYRGNGSLRQEFFFKGVLARKITMTSPLAVQLAGYTLIERDLRMVQQWLERIYQFPRSPKTRSTPGWLPTDKDDASHNLCLGLFVASLSFYGKCFSQCEGRRIKLDIEWVPKDLRDTHLDVLTMRNNFAAHSGAEKFEEVNISLLLAVQRGRLRDEPILFRGLSQLEVMLDLEGDNVGFPRLVRELREKVIKKADELNDKIFADELRPAGWAHWVEMSKRP